MLSNSLSRPGGPFDGFVSTLTLDIDAEAASGFPEDVESVVRDNARVLRITDFGFEAQRYAAKRATTDRQARRGAVSSGMTSPPRLNSSSLSAHHCIILTRSSQNSARA